VPGVKLSTFLSIKNTTKAGDNIDLWHHVTCRNFSESEYWRESDEPFGAHILSREFGALTLSDVSLSTSGMTRLARSPAAIRKDPRDHFMVFLVEQGGIGVSQDGRQMQAQAGDLFLYDQTRPFTLEFQQRYVGLMVNIPRPLLESRLHTASRLTAHRISGESKLGALAGTMVRQIHGLDQQLKDDAVNRLGASALDILAMTLDEKSSNECISNPRHHRLLGQVKEYMLAHLHDSSLDIETVARAQNMAPRTLNRRQFGGCGSNAWRRVIEP
jgi:hypothetical protein